MKTSHLFWLLLWLPLALAGCGEGSTSKPSGATDNGYDIKGKVVSVNADADKPITLDHEDIPGVMNAMQMSFKVEDAKMLQGIKAGDQVHGRVRKGDSGLVITRLEKD